MKRMQFVLALALAGSMGSAAAMGPGYLGDLVGQNVSITNTISGLGTPIADIYSFDIGTLTLGSHRYECESDAAIRIQQHPRFRYQQFRDRP